MTYGEMKQKLCTLVELYFSGATVVWDKTKLVRPLSPLIALTEGTITRPYQPITQSVNGVPINYYPSKTTIQVDLFTKGSPVDNGSGVTGAMENTAVNDLTDFVNFLNSVFVDDWTDENDMSILAKTVQNLTQLINDTSWDYRAMVELEVSFTQSSVGHAGIMYDGGMPYYENGKPKYSPDGIPLYPNGKPMYNENGDTLDENGNAIDPPLDEDGKPILPPIEPGGKPPQFIPTPSGGGAQSLADDATGWFEQVEKIQEEESSNG